MIAIVRCRNQECERLYRVDEPAKACGRCGTAFGPPHPSAPLYFEQVIDLVGDSDTRASRLPTWQEHVRALLSKGELSVVPSEKETLPGDLGRTLHAIMDADDDILFAMHCASGEAFVVTICNVVIIKAGITGGNGTATVVPHESLEELTYNPKLSSLVLEGLDLNGLPTFDPYKMVTIPLPKRQRVQYAVELVSSIRQQCLAHARSPVSRFCSVVPADWRQTFPSLVEAHVKQSLHEDERIYVKLEPAGGQYVVVTSKRVLLLKWGGDPTGKPRICDVTLGEIKSVLLRVGIIGGHVELKSERFQTVFDPLVAANAFTFSAAYMERMRAIVPVLERLITGRQ